MKREAAVGAPWRELWGIVVTVLSAVLLAAVLWQVSRLSNEAGLDRVTLQRERISVTEVGGVLAVLDAIDAYNYALVLDRPERRELAPKVTAAYERVARDLKYGPAAVLNLSKQWRTLQRMWTVQGMHIQPGPSAYDRSDLYLDQTFGFLQTLQDTSNLTYDPSVLTQNLADTFVSETPTAIVSAARIQTLIDLSAKDRGMSLAHRMVLASNITSMQTGINVTSDNLPLMADMLASLLPTQRAQWQRLPALSQEMFGNGGRFADLVSAHALLELNGPSRPSATFADAALQLTVPARALHDLAGVALDTSLARRGEIQALRNRYLYIAFFIGTMLLLGIMLSIAQLIAFRGRAAIKKAQDESMQLQTELARQEAEQALKLSEAQFRAVFDGAALGIAVLDRTGGLVEANGVFRAMFGDSISTALEGHQDDVMALFAGQRETFEFEQNLRVPSGEIWTDVTVSIVNDDRGQPLYAICMFRDKTALKHSERRMQYDKMHDSLTGLPNRQLFEEHLRARFAEANALLDSFFAVVFIDLEHFKDVNESLGHAAGDLVLTQVAGRMRSAVDPRDVVARLGSDEFAVLIRSLGDILHVESVARRILNNLGKPITIGSRTIYLGACVGVAIGSSGYEQAEDVMRDAETAMQHAKSMGGSRYAVFDSKMHARAEKRLELTSDLRLALDRGEFRVVYQPIVRLQDAQPVGCEALVRWDHPTEGLISPMDFIPLAEQTGLASPIGRLVRQTAAEQLAAWRRNRGGSLEFRMNVNVSASELNDPDFERILVQLVEHNGLLPSDITLEITENVVLDAATRANVTLERVRDRGFGICIDDFGTGYSSLRYLQQFKVDAIKIDRSFVSGPDGELASEPIVRTLMTLAEAYNVRVVAEGVETARQRDVLRNAGCRLAQGYLFAQPLSAAEMTTLYPEVLGRIGRSASA
jgi:diguanylate cyclase (GGDEF)-like protein/PAS domain S-box-containing protein